MCGIFVTGGFVNESNAEVARVLQEELLPFVRRRGPDVFSEYCVTFMNWKIDLYGSVLWMQGKKPIVQPIRDTEGNVLLWNGDIFDGALVPGDGESDTSVVLQNIFGSNMSEEGILKSLSAVRGPYSLVYWSEQTRKLWFGRDRIGRHSLLCCYQENGLFTLTSVGKRGVPFLEVPVIGIFVMSFSEDSYKLTVHPWSDVSNEECDVVKNFPVPVSISQCRMISPVVTKCPIPYEPTKKYFEFLEESRQGHLHFFDKLMSHVEISSNVDELLQCLKRAVQIRCTVHPGRCRKCLIRINTTSHRNEETQCSHPKVGVLFSGGLDSTVIAALAHTCVPTHIPIDLFNVAFENCKGSAAKDDEQYSRNGVKCSFSRHFNTPDRTTGIQSSEELRATFPNRQWNFIQINISKEELDNFRRTKVGDLIYPLNSILDDSLGCALWFASQLHGVLRDIEYTSPARVLLLGMGADEQFGGYMRHRTTLRHKGWAALAGEIDMELQRIATRNLGRDDRIVGDHGCQGRFPFLDENLINFVSSLPVWARCYPTAELSPGVGDKLLLRLVAWKLGLKRAASFPKRAFQFGSRIANSKEKASDTSSRLM